MVGTLLKILGVAVLIGGVLGWFVGGFTIVYGEIQMARSDDAHVAGDMGRARSGAAAKEAGVAIVGASFLVSGLGLALLVADLAVGTPRVNNHQQPSQVSIARSPPRTN